MIVTGVKLTNYRSYKQQAFEMEPGVNIIVGPNASGKTNILEAIYVAGQGRSFRTADAELISHAKPWARIDLYLEKNQRTVKLWRDSEKSKEFEVDHNKSRRLKPADKIPTILFTPDDLRSLSGSPQNRRRLIDGIVTTAFNDGQATIGRFQRALLQRNNLLKQDNPNKDELFVWAVRLGELGGKLAEYRQKVISQLNQQAGNIYSNIAGKKHEIRFVYDSKLGTGKTYRHKLDKHLQSQEDQKMGFTSQGPHRDDLVVKISGHTSQTSASRGELRTLVLVAKIIETNILEKRAKQKPLLLFDDVFSELDSSRRQHLSQHLSKYQSIITTTDADAVIEHFSKDRKIISIAIGRGG